MKGLLYLFFIIKVLPNLQQLDDSKMRPTASYILKNLATHWTDPTRAELLMKSTLNCLLLRNRSICQVNLLDKLIRNKIGTNNAERIMESLVKEGKRTGKNRNVRILTQIMNIKLEDAKADRKAKDYQWHKSKRMRVGETCQGRCQHGVRLGGGADEQ